MKRREQRGGHRCRENHVGGCDTRISYEDAARHKNKRRSESKPSHTKAAHRQVEEGYSRERGCRRWHARGELVHAEQMVTRRGHPIEQRWLFKLKQRQKRARLSYSQHRMWAELRPPAALMQSRMSVGKGATPAPPTNIMPLPLPDAAAEEYATAKTAAA